VDRTYLLPLLKLVQVMYAIIANADTPHLPIFYSFNQGLPRSQPALFPTIRRVQEIEINIPQPSLPQTLVNTLLRVIVIDTLWRDLGGVKELLSLYPSG